MMQQGRAKRQRSVVFKFVGVSIGVGEGFFELVDIGVVGFGIGLLLAMEGEASG